MNAPPPGWWPPAALRCAAPLSRVSIGQQQFGDFAAHQAESELTTVRCGGRRTETERRRAIVSRPMKELTRWSSV
jgi:hypothetical protein